MTFSFYFSVRWRRRVEKLNSLRIFSWHDTRNLHIFRMIKLGKVSCCFCLLKTDKFTVLIHRICAWNDAITEQFGTSNCRILFYVCVYRQSELQSGWKCANQKWLLSSKYIARFVIFDYYSWKCCNENAFDTSDDNIKIYSDAFNILWITLKRRNLPWITLNPSN